MGDLFIIYLIANLFVTTIVPHPLKLNEDFLVLPELEGVLLVDDYSYIITQETHLYSISLTKQLLLTIEPIYNKQKSTCDWEGYRQNSTRMLEICNYNKVGEINDTFVVETDKHRLAYFPVPTRVTQLCPEVTRETLTGLHQLSLSCDVETDSVFWPAKQMVTIALQYNDSFQVDSTFSPIINVSTDNKMHKSLKKLITKLPASDESYTIDFDYHGLTLKKVQSYSIYAQSIITLIVILNTVAIGVIIYVRTTKSLKFRNKSKNRKRFRSIKDSLQSRGNSITSNELWKKIRRRRDSLRSTGSSIRKRFTPAFNPSNSKTKGINIGTNTGTNYDLAPPKEKNPPIPRYW